MSDSKIILTDKPEIPESSSNFTVNSMTPLVLMLIDYTDNGQREHRMIAINQITDEFYMIGMHPEAMLMSKEFTNKINNALEEKTRQIQKRLELIGLRTTSDGRVITPTGKAMPIEWGLQQLRMRNLMPGQEQEEEQEEEDDTAQDGDVAPEDEDGEPINAEQVGEIMREFINGEAAETTSKDTVQG